jgi:serine/threonine-protein phosphatase PP1 catalytic subunit
MAASDSTIEEVIKTYRQAAEASCHREACLVELGAADAEDIVISTDLHGQRLSFRQVLKVTDWPNHPRRHLIMQEVCHGGPHYPHGGCMSHLLLEDIAALKAEHPDRFHFLLSNHELAELMDFPITKSNRMLNLHFRNGMRVMYGDACEEVRSAMSGFLRSCPLAVRLDNGVFICHSAPASVDEMGFDPAIFERRLQASDLETGGAAFRLVWGRDFRQENADAFCKLVNADLLIHGHEPCPEGVHAPNERQVILDSCGNHARIAILPLGRPLTLHDVLACVRPLFEPPSPNAYPFASEDPP